MQPSAQPPATSRPASAPGRSSPALIAAAWLLVSIPAAWGVYNTGKNAMKLFSATPSASAPANTVAR